jgi:hypothetical protein
LIFDPTLGRSKLDDWMHNRVRGVVTSSCAVDITGRKE